MWFLESNVSTESSVMLDLIRTILLDICNIIYKLIIVLYELFMAVGDATILNSNGVQVIFNRVGLILGIIMMFRLIFSFVQYLLDPDKVTDKETGVGGLIKKIIIVVLALGLTNWVFEKAFDLQSKILQENVIGKIVLGVNSNDDIDMEAYGTIFSYTLFSNFFYLNPELDTTDDSQLKGCGKDYFETTMKNYIGTYKDLDFAHECVNVHGSVVDNHALSGNKVYYAVFNGLEALVVGGFVLWVLFMYTITLGVRVVKLAFLRIIAPIPILSYLAPKKSSAFSNWLKQSLTTYLDLFIRIAIIYFAMLLISIIFDPNQGALIGSGSLAPDDSLYKWFKLILVLGVLLFAKKMPEILGEIFPFMGGKGGLDFGLGLKSRTDFAGKGLVTRTVGAAIGAVSMGALGAGQGLFRQAKNASGELEQAHGIKRGLNTLTGGLSGVARGVRYGAHGGKIRDNIDKAFHNQVAASASTNDYIAAGGDSYASRIMAGIGRELGLPTAYDRLKAHQQNLENRKKLNTDLINTLGQAGGTLDGITDRLSSKITGDDAKTVFGENTPEHILKYLEAADVIGRDDNGVWRVVKSGRTVRNDDGDIVSKPNFGDALFGKRYDEIDNIIENSKNEIQQRIEFLNEEKNKTIQRVFVLRAQTSSDPTLNPNATETEKKQYKSNKEEIMRLESTLGGYETQLSDAYAELNTINVTAKVKKMKEAGTIGLILGQYDDEVAKNDMITFTVQADSAVKQVDAYVASNVGSKDPVVVKRTEELKKGAALLNEMNETLKSIRKASSDGNISEEMIVAELEKFKDAKYQSAVDFDLSNPDGSFETKKIEIKNLFDLVDNIANYQKAIMRSKQHENVGLDREIFETNQSAEMVRERLADEHRIGGKGSSH